MSQASTLGQTAAATAGSSKPGSWQERQAARQGQQQAHWHWQSSNIQQPGAAPCSWLGPPAHPGAWPGVNYTSQHHHVLVQYFCCPLTAALTGSTAPAFTIAGIMFKEPPEGAGFDAPSETSYTETQLGTPFSAALLPCATSCSECIHSPPPLSLSLYRGFPPLYPARLTPSVSLSPSLNITCSAAGSCNHQHR